jgi:geranylgeranyl diphosphate synthase type II
MANPTQKAQLQEWISKTDFVPAEKIQAVTAIYDAVGIKTLCHDKIEQLFAQSLDCLAKVKVDEARKSELKAFADKLLKRNK